MDTIFKYTHHVTLLLRFNVSASDVDPSLVTSFPFSCSGSEDSLDQCQTSHTTCNYFHDNAADIVTIECGGSENSKVSPYY